MGVNNRFRFNPFTEVYNPVLIPGEIHKIEYHVEVDAYGFFLDEAPRFDSPSSVVITGYAEVSRLTTPTGTQFRVDYFADTYWGLGFVEFNVALDGTDVTVDEYYGLGTILHPNFRLATNFNFPGRVTFESYLKFLTSLSVEKAVREMTSTGSLYDMVNVYEDAGTMRHFATGRARRLRIEPDGIYSDVSSQSAGVAASWTSEGQIFPTGGIIAYAGTTAPAAGWVLGSGRTIGSVSSGAKERANVDTQNLFTLLWNHTDAALPIYTSAGASVNRGDPGYTDAATAWASNARMTLPDLRGRVWVGKDDMGGTAAGRVTLGGSGLDGLTLLAVGGAEIHTLAISEMPSHAHTQVAHNHTDTTSGAGSHNHNVGYGQLITDSGFRYGAVNTGVLAYRPQLATGTTQGIWSPVTDTANNHTHSVNTTNATPVINNTGGGGAHNNVQPGIVGLVIIKL